MVYQFIERAVSQKYDRWEAGYADEYELVLRCFDESRKAVSQSRLAYCILTIDDDGAAIVNSYREVAQRYMRTYVWIPNASEPVKHGIDGGIDHNQGFKYQKGGFESGEFDVLAELIVDDEQPLYEAGCDWDAWIRAKNDLDVEVMKYLKVRPSKTSLLHSDVFEKLVLELHADMGYEVQWVGRNQNVSGDGILVGSIAGKGVPTLVEAKCYPEHRRVSIDHADRLWGAKERQGFPRAMLVTTSRVTEGLRQSYGAKLDFEIVEFSELKEWLIEYRVASSVKLDKG